MTESLSNLARILIDRGVEVPAANDRVDALAIEAGKLGYKGRPSGLG